MRQLLLNGTLRETNQDKGQQTGKKQKPRKKQKQTLRGKGYEDEKNNVMQNGTYIFISQTLSVERKNKECQPELREQKTHYNAIISKRQET